MHQCRLVLICVCSSQVVRNRCSLLWQPQHYMFIFHLFLTTRRSCMDLGKMTGWNGDPGGYLNTKMSSYRYRDLHIKDTTVLVFRQGPGCLSGRLHGDLLRALQYLNMISDTQAEPIGGTIKTIHGKKYQQVTLPGWKLGIDWWQATEACYFQCHEYSFCIVPIGGKSYNFVAIHCVSVAQIDAPFWFLLHCYTSPTTLVHIRCNAFSINLNWDNSIWYAVASLLSIHDFF